MMRMMGWISLLLAMVAMALALPDRASLSALAMLAVRGDPSAGGPLLPCGTSGDFVQDQRQLIDVFEFVKGVCAQRGESCPAGAPLPASCGSAECQRAVQLAEDSCGPAFAKDGFLKDAFKPILDAAVAVCASAPSAGEDVQVRSLSLEEPPAPGFAPACSATERPVVSPRSATSSLATSRPAARSRLRRRMVGCSPTAWVPAATTRRQPAWTTRWCGREPGRRRCWRRARCG